ERSDRHDSPAGERADRPHEREVGGHRNSGENEAGEPAHREKGSESGRKLLALVHDQRERSGDDERARDREQPRLAAGIDVWWSDEEHEERGTEPERDPAV